MNKDAYLRYCIIDECLHNSPRGWTVKELMEKIEAGLCERYPNRAAITRQQFYLDIREMESYEFWNIEFKKTKTRPVLYSYADPSCSIHDKGLPPHFRENLQAACNLLHTYRGLPQLDWLSDSITHMEIYTQDPSGASIEFESNCNPKGVNFLSTIYKAVRECYILNVVYRPYGGRAYYTKFKPLFIKQYNKRWWVFGYSERTGDIIQVQCLDRYGEVVISDEHFDRPQIDWESYFKEVVGVTNKPEQKCQRVKFLAYGKGRLHIRYNPIHHSQKFRIIDDNTYEYKLYLKINYELKKTLMQYAHEIKILEPPELVEEHKKWLFQALEHYSDAIQ